VRSPSRSTWLADVALALGALLAPASAPAGAAEPQRRVVMISIDGLMPDHYLRADELGLEVPNLRRLMRDGAYGRSVSVLPSVTYPAHTTLITGVPPRLHGIDSNTVFDPLLRSNEAWLWYAGSVRVPTLVSAARAASLSTATISWPVSVGIGSDWNLPEFWRSGSQHESDLQLLEQLATPGLIAGAGQHRGRPFRYPLTDTERVDAALYVIERHRPALTLLHVFDLDSAQHRHGPMTPEAKQAVEQSDAQLGRILEALQRAGAWEGTLVAVVSDHGFLPISTTLRPNVLLRDAGLIDVDAQGRTTGWRAFFHASGGSAALRLAQAGDEATLRRVRGLLEPHAGRPGSGVRALLERERIAALGGPGDAVLAIDAAEGFSISSDVKGEWSSPSSSKGTHGYAPDRHEMHAALILGGPGAERRGPLGVVAMTSIAPTLARHLGLVLSREAGPPLPKQ
jgi:predicted AlkP superfamily pyrophosphatase or phosphodiesterase